MESEKHYDVVIIGGGASGTALLYTLSHYTNISKIALFEKYSEVGQVNSNAKNNSQTLHVGDIETNYSFKKVQEVRPAALMVKKYVEMLTEENRKHILETVSKMVLAVGYEEVQSLDARFSEISSLFPDLQKITEEDIARIEPEVMRGRNPKEPVLALYTKEGYAVDFGALAHSFVAEAKKNTAVSVHLGEGINEIIPNKEGYRIETLNGGYQARVVVVNTDAYSLGFAKSLGYGKEFSLIPIAGSFYFSKKFLQGKVYTMQEPRLPFASVHGDPDLNVPDKTRWGPTARFFPVLESGKLNTSCNYFTSSGLHRLPTWLSFFSILSEPVRFWYLLKNFCYEIPWLGTRLFVKQIQKIVPTITARDLEKASGYGGMRLQRVNTETKELLLGEGKIIGKNIIFNMTPSPGASVCLYNAMRDAEQVAQFLPEYHFDIERMKKELL
jgi:malate dehydrogenase (quinone)